MYIVLATSDECVSSLSAGTLKADRYIIGEKPMKAFLEMFPQSDDGLYPDVYAVLVDGRQTYPKNYLYDMGLTIKELSPQISTKLPDAKGVVYGIAGVMVLPDKDRNLDTEFDALTQVGAPPGYKAETRNQVGYGKDTMTVDYLELWGGIIVHRSLLDDSAPELPDMVQKDTGDIADCTSDISDSAHLSLCPSLSFELAMSSYLAERSYSRLQICNLYINRYVMIRMGLHEETMNDCEKSDQCVKIAAFMRKNNNFHIYDNTT